MLFKAIYCFSVVAFQLCNSHEVKNKNVKKHQRKNGSTILFTQLGKPNTVSLNEHDLKHLRNHITGLSIHSTFVKGDHIVETHEPQSDSKGTVTNQSTSQQSATPAQQTTPPVQPASSTTQVPDTSPNKAVEESKSTKELSDPNTNENVIEGYKCKLLWFLFSDCNKNPIVPTEENKTTTTPEETAPVVSQHCVLYGSANLSLSDFKNPDEDWIIVNEGNSSRITHSKQVEAEKPAVLQLNELLCNAATYEATIKLGVESSGGLVIRGSEESYIALEMNSLSKTVTLKKVNGTTQEIINDVACPHVNSQFVTKLEIRDTGYKGQIDILIDGQRTISANNLPYTTSGYFGLYLSMGNATFGDLSVIPTET
ncbi:uncharacterized protein BdWA1_004053 [Babesia duncani]|uniref:Uncharacterized protein n=1 Tax=Babesia duncani TaxID=323732 RepID=A0AAD9PGZ3_9APIC|nr:hypothetical protein BdWA1_004053 [Babesia duncani]